MVSANANAPRLGVPCAPPECDVEEPFVAPAIGPVGPVIPNALRRHSVERDCRVLDTMTREVRTRLLDAGGRRDKLSDVIGSGNVRIRRAERGDEHVLLLLAQSFATSFRLDSARFSMQLETILADRASVLLVAATDGGVIGYVGASVHPTLYASGLVGWIEELMVEPRQRRGGVGRLLVSAVEGWIEAQGAVMVALATRRAGEFWLAVGYEESATYFRKLL